jgi:predicted amidohydrolase
MRILPALLVLAGCASSAAPPPPAPAPDATIKVAAIQPKSRVIDPGLSDPGEILRRVEASLEELAGLLAQAARAGCGAAALPEDTCGLGRLEAGNPELARRILPRAVDLMLARLGRAAREHRMVVVCCNDTVEPDGREANVAFLLGPDGRLIGRYLKVNMPIHELYKKRGDGFPVFPTPGLGRVGMLICYDMVFPEAARCLALGGADLIFHPTLGGAAIGDGEVSRCAFRTRAVENFVYLVVAQRGGGSMLVSPKGEILAEAPGPDSLAIAEIRPRGGRDGGDAMNHQEDMRARLFRERHPAAFGLLSDPHPPVLDLVPEVTSVDEAVRVSRGALSEGEDRFRAASRLEGDAAIRAYEALVADYPRSWIDRVSRQRLEKLRGGGK